MSYRRRFDDYTPSPRTLAEGAWTRVLVREGAAPDSLEQIDDQALTPVDADPAVPATRTVITTLAELPVGWYDLTFTALDGSQEPTAPVFYSGGLTPSAQQVARFIRARTTGLGGELGVFTTQTNPTLEQADGYIADAASDVVAEVGRSIPAGASDLFRTVVTIGAAILIELNSEQINTERLRGLQAMYDARLPRLVNAVQDVEGGGDPGQVDDRPAPIGTFPCPEPMEW
jgi:hypothetical protein